MNSIETEKGEEAVLFAVATIQTFNEVPSWVSIDDPYMNSDDNNISVKLDGIVIEAVIGPVSPWSEYSIRIVKVTKEK